MLQEGFRRPQEETRGMGSGDFQPNGAKNELGLGFSAALLGLFAVFRRGRAAPTGFSGWLAGVRTDSIGNHGKS